MPLFWLFSTTFRFISELNMLCMFFLTCWDRPVFSDKLQQWREEACFTYGHQLGAISLKNREVPMAEDVPPLGQS